jgi:hypothetical protein
MARSEESCLPARKEAMQMTACVQVRRCHSVFLWLTDKTLEWVFMTYSWMENVMIRPTLITEVAEVLRDTDVRHAVVRCACLFRKEKAVERNITERNRARRHGIQICRFLFLPKKL